MNMGIHASVRHGFLHALVEASELNCHTLQIFPRRPGDPFRFLSPSEIEETERFRALHSIDPLIVHSVFQPNIASSNQKTWQRSRDSLLEELQFSDQIGAAFLVIHSGSYSPDSDKWNGIKKSARTIRWALERVSSKTKIAIENVAGGGRRLGSRLDELSSLLNEIGLENRTGICFDTAHAFAAGYAIQTAMGMEDCLSELEKTIGFDHLEIFHINDSSAEFGSHKDIHQHIGKGWIGLEALKGLVRNPLFDKKAGILETPKSPPLSDQTNLSILRG